MIGKIISAVEALCTVISVGALSKFLRALSKKRNCQQPLTIEDHLYKVARITGKSEYDVFCKSAENWPITGEKIDQDFKAYLLDQRVPYYVVDFVRKNKKHIDELHIPLL